QDAEDEGLHHRRYNTPRKPVPRRRAASGRIDKKSWRLVCTSTCSTGKTAEHWMRERAESTTMRQDLEKNILVISDLHLGEDLRPGVANVSYLRHLVKLERELESFLGHYAEHRIGDRPWRLVVNGDMVDFMSIMILPDSDDPVDAEDRLYGLGFG